MNPPSQDSPDGLTLREAAARLRAQPVPETVEHQVWQAVHKAAQSQRPPPVALWPSWLSMGVASGLAAAVLAVVVYHSLPEEQLIIERERRLDLALETEDVEPVEVELSTHHHADDDHHVRVEAPVGVQVALNPPQPGPAPACGTHTCVHTFARSDNGRARLVLSVAQPGRYPIAVQHASPRRKVREHFVLHAHP